jgi:hypothetical protein
MRRVAEELLPAVRRAIGDQGNRTGGAGWNAAVLTATAAALTDFCINPNPGGHGFPALRIQAGGTVELPAPAFLCIVLALRRNVAARAFDSIAQTTIATRVGETLAFSFETGRACLIEGAPRTGKSCAAKAFCEAHPGLARYIVTPPGSAEQDLLRAVADAIGVADSCSYKNVQIRNGVEEVLRRSRLALVFDEAQWLLPQHLRVQSHPQRLLWFK